jgi:hypothetical protein
VQFFCCTYIGGGGGGGRRRKEFETKVGDDEIEEMANLRWGREENDYDGRGEYGVGWRW